MATVTRLKGRSYYRASGHSLRGLFVSKEITNVVLWIGGTKTVSPTVTTPRISDPVCDAMVTRVVMRLNGKQTRPALGWVDEFEYETTRG